MNSQLNSFTAIDFETANYKRTSACSLGIIQVENGVIVSENCYLIKPQPYYFIPSFIDIHHITKDQVADAPLFGELWPDIRTQIEEANYLVAHNASFDMSVLRACLKMEMIHAHLPESLCTVQLSRQMLTSLPNHQLDTVCNYFHLELDHHEALSDARGCANILLELQKMSSCQ